MMPSVFPVESATCSAYFLGPLAHRRFQLLQRSLAYSISEQPGSAAIIVCEHPPSITIGRDGSRNTLGRLPSRWPVLYAARGGGAMLHLPGQVVIAPIISLEAIRLTPAVYRIGLETTLIELLASFNVSAHRLAERPGVWVGERLIAHLGIAVRSGITSFGVTLNVAPDLELFRGVHVDGHPQPMTSLARESTLRVQLSTVRQRLAEAVAARLGFDSFHVLHHHPALAIEQPHADDPADC